MRLLLSSNVSLPIEVYRFLKRSLISKGFNGYFDIDWAGSAGSGREFYRVFIGRNITLVLMVWDGRDRDWDYFLEIAELNFSTSVTPRVFNYDRGLGVVLLEDAGFRQLKDLFRGVYSYKDKSSILKLTVENLHAFHTVDVNDVLLLKGRYYDFEHALWESSYFSEHVISFFPDLKIEFDDLWETEVKKLAKHVTSLKTGFMHRDFQSENILIKDGKPTFVDVQGARIGPVEYDIASLLYDPYIYSAMGEEIRVDTLTYCCFLFSVSLSDIQKAAIQRLLQAIGAYCNLSRNKGKKRYVKFIKPALVGLSSILEQTVEFPRIASVVAAVLEKHTKR